MMISSSLGLLVGLILALTGAGGGILAVPLRVFGAHLSLQREAPRLCRGGSSSLTFTEVIHQ